MSAAYWSQWDSSELLSMHGVELNEVPITAIDWDLEDEETDEDEVECYRCNDNGCNYCLCVSW